MFKCVLSSTANARSLTKPCTMYVSLVWKQICFQRIFSRLVSSQPKFNKPPSDQELPQPCGIASMMRLPVQSNTDGLDACFIGVPLDTGTNYKNGCRFGPRYIRSESVVIGPANTSTGAAPFDSLQVADVGDVALSLYNLTEACQQIRDHFALLIQNGCKPLAIGGDHTISYPILQAIKEKYGPVGMVHIDAHADTGDVMSNSKIAHGTPFRRAFEDGCLDGERVFQIGLRGQANDNEPYKASLDQGFKVVTAEECWNKSMTPLMEKVRSHLGNGPVYLTFDIDAIDPSFAPGTGFPEIAGLASIQAVEILRGCRGLNIIGCDLVEVSPSYDPTGITSLLAANLLFEMLCILPGVKYD